MTETDTSVQNFCGLPRLDRNRIHYIPTERGSCSEVSSKPFKSLFRMRVLITDPLSPVALDLLEKAGIEGDVQLKKSPEELAVLAQSADGWIIRSGTQITADLIEAGSQLKVIGRAGVGVDNVDLKAATRKGVLVVNAPDGNTISTAEHTCAMILALARRIPRAASSLAGGAWERKQFSGAELDGKTLGVVGVGKIGRAVAQRMQAFGMKVIGFDPLLAAETAERLNIELVPLERIWAESDVITFHTPLNDATRRLLHDETIAQCKDGVRVVNIARGGIIDEQALLSALESGKVAGAALDVYSQEPPPRELASLLEHPSVVATPHIAASTEEAQEKVAIQIVDQVVRALRGEPVTTPVNAGAMRKAAQPEIAPYINMAERLGTLSAQLVRGSVERIVVECAGVAVSHFADVVAEAALVGILGRWSEVPVNLVNASTLAQEMGLVVEELRRSEGGEYSNEVAVTTYAGTRSRTVRGTILGDNEIRLVGFDNYPIEVRLEGHFLFYQNVDRPGMLAAVGSVLAEGDVNIAGLTLGREAPGSTALTVLTTDEPIPPPLLERIANHTDIQDVIVASV